MEELTSTSPETEFADGPVADQVAGCEWIVDATGCARERLRSLDALRDVCDRIVRELNLVVVGLPQWRQFPDPGGVTGLLLLSESHLACHTWPESGIATFNLFCCHRRREWPWQPRLTEMLAAESVMVRMMERGCVTTPTAPIRSAGGAR